MKKVLFLISCSLLLISCEKEKIIEVIKEYKWKSHPSFQYEDVLQMNSYASKDRLFFLGSCFSSLIPDSINHPDLSFGGKVSHYANWSDLPSNKKLPICADYYIAFYQGNSWVNFIPTRNPLAAEAAVSLDMKSLDSTFESFDLLQYHSGVCMAINKKNQALIPYFSAVGSERFVKFALVDIKAEFNPNLINVYLDTTNTKIVRIPGEDRYGITALESNGDYFFITIGAMVYRIDNLGNIVNISGSPIYKIIESSGTLYGFGYDKVNISSNNGLSWGIGYTTPFEFSVLNYSIVDNKIIGYRDDQLWEISVSENELIVKELDNDGLKGVLITSVSGFNGKVYLTSFSGVYYKLTSDFFEYKPE